MPVFWGMTLPHDLWLIIYSPYDQSLIHDLYDKNGEQKNIKCFPKTFPFPQIFQARRLDRSSESNKTRFAR
jgi:hypothetical protein